MEVNEVNTKKKTIKYKTNFRLSCMLNRDLLLQGLKTSTMKLGLLKNS